MARVMMVAQKLLATELSSAIFTIPCGQFLMMIAELVCLNSNVCSFVFFNYLLHGSQNHSQTIVAIYVLLIIRYKLTRTYSFVCCKLCYNYKKIYNTFGSDLISNCLIKSDFIFNNLYLIFFYNYELVCSLFFM